MPRVTVTEDGHLDTSQLSAADAEYVSVMADWLQAIRLEDVRIGKREEEFGGREYAQDLIHILKKIRTLSARARFLVQMNEEYRRNGVYAHKFVVWAAQEDTMQWWLVRAWLAKELLKSKLLGWLYPNKDTGVKWIGML